MTDNSNDLPLPKEKQNGPEETNPALHLIRQKLDNLYVKEPSAAQEEQEIEALGPQSKHQQFINQLMGSGKSLAEIQTAWHDYYQTLPDREKHIVWQEFYDNYERSSKYFANVSVKRPPLKHQTKDQPLYKPPEKMVGHFEPKPTTPVKSSGTIKTAESIKKHLLDTVTARGKLKAKHHIQSLLFGLSMGVLAIAIIMFTFFNERFIAPFITPSRNVTDTPIIIDPTQTISADPLVIIPKINVEVPVVYGVPSIDEKVIHDALDSGVVQYPTSAVPGQNGNVAIVGHSSNNIFNKGKYKFAFVLLSRLEEGDTFMLNYNGKQYLYKVYQKKIVAPTEVSVLGPTDRLATATLITCDPPGTAVHRLVIIGEQISPNPSANLAASTTSTIATQPKTVPGESESLFHRLFSWIWQ
jgi:sortase A